MHHRRSPADDRQRDPHDGARTEVPRWLPLRCPHRAAVDARRLRAGDTGLADDQHPITGRKLGREGAKLVPPPTEPDPFEGEAYRLWAIKRQGK